MCPAVTRGCMWPSSPPWHLVQRSSRRARFPAAPSGAWNCRARSHRLRACRCTQKQVSDAANLFRLNLDQPVPAAAADRLTTGDPFTDRELGANWRFVAARTSFTLGYLDIRERHKINPASDRNVNAATALLARALTPVLNWDIGAEYERQEFAAGGSSSTVNAMTSLRWQIAPQLRLRFLYAHSALTPHGYAENQLGVTASYAFIEGAPGNAQPGVQPAAP